MKITLSENNILTSLYARSAMQTYVAEHPGGYVANILTTAQAPACRAIISDAFNIALAALQPGWRRVEADQPGQLAAEAPDDLSLDTTTVAALLEVAVAEYAVCIIFGVAGDRRAATAHATASSVLSKFNTRGYSVERLSLGY